MQFEEVVLIVMGIVGVLLGAVGLATRLDDMLGILMGLLVLGMGGLSLWLSWLFLRERFSPQPNK